MTGDVERSGPSSIPAVIREQGGTVWEARLRYRHGEPRDVQVVVSFPSAALVAYESIVACGGTVVENPAGLFGGRPLPSGVVLTFTVPAVHRSVFLA